MKRRGGGKRKGKGKGKAKGKGKGSGGFSAKKKKEYLKQKRERKKQQQAEDEQEETEFYQKKPPVKKEVGGRFVSAVQSDYKLRSLFLRESEEEIQRKKNITTKDLDRKKFVEMNIDEFEPYQIPLPPNLLVKGGEMISDEELPSYFKKEYMERITRTDMNMFEQNVYVWREFWKVLHVSDVFFVLCDVRHPVVHFPSSLVRVIVEVLGKPLILILNKCDIVSKEFSTKWKQEMCRRYPKVHVLEFSSFRSPRKKKQIIDKASIFSLWDCCKKLTGKEEHWDDLIKLTRFRFKHEDKCQDFEKDDTEIRIGVIGHPNTGKSTLINTLLMDHKATTSLTPGKTKEISYFQLSKYVALVDSPGLVFPIAGMCKEMSILCGLFPIAQDRVPIHTVMYIAERIPLEDVLQLRLPEEYDNWSAFAICEAFAEKMNFKTKRGHGRNDVHRGANYILRQVLLGKVPFMFYPPGMKKKLYEKKSRFDEVKRNRDKKKKQEEDFLNSLDIQKT